MIIKTILSWNTLAKYAAMMWNNSEDPYTPTGDAFIECVEAEDEDFVLTADWLKSDCEWQIQKHESMLAEDDSAFYHKEYLAGRRDPKTTEWHNKYLKYRDGIREFKRELKKWIASVEVVPEWTYDTDETEFINFPHTLNGKAAPILTDVKKTPERRMHMVTIVDVATEKREDRIYGTAILESDVREELDKIIDFCEIVDTPRENDGKFFVDIPFSAINHILTTIGQRED